MSKEVSDNQEDLLQERIKAYAKHCEESKDITFSNPMLVARYRYGDPTMTKAECIEFYITAIADLEKRVKMPKDNLTNYFRSMLAQFKESLNDKAFIENMKEFPFKPK